MKYLDVRLVLDTNVLVSAFRSRRGASYWLVRAALQGRFSLLCSTALFLEYEAVLGRASTRLATGLRPENVNVLMDTLASVALPVELSFRTRPLLRDSDDEMVLEAAVNGGADSIVTHNTKDFAPAKLLGIDIVKPGDMVRRLKDE